MNVETESDHVNRENRKRAIVSVHVSIVERSFNGLLKRGEGVFLTQKVVDSIIDFTGRSIEEMGTQFCSFVVKEHGKRFKADVKMYHFETENVLSFHYFNLP